MFICGLDGGGVMDILCLSVREVGGGEGWEATSELRHSQRRHRVANLPHCLRL